MQYINSIEIEPNEDKEKIEALKLLCLKDLLRLIAMDIQCPNTYQIKFERDMSPITGVKVDERLMYIIKAQVIEV